MARKATGQVIEPKDGRGWAIRFRAYGKRRYVALGTAEEGWEREKAEAALRHVLADVERGIWRPPMSESVEAPAEVPTFHEFASEWYANREAGWRPNTRADYMWALQHLLPYFKNHLLTEITAEEVDRYAHAKQAEGELSNNSINKTLTRLSQILEIALDYKKVARNEAKGKKRRLPGKSRNRSWVEPEQLPSLLAGCGGELRPLIAVLAGAGLRISEAIALVWADINLAAATIRVMDAKTPAGYRVIDVPVGAAAELRIHKARSRKAAPSDAVFLNQQGEPQKVRNAQERLKPAIRKANRKLPEEIDPISEQVTPHSLRRTYASMRFALGDDPVYVTAQLGHTESGFSMRVYAHAVKRRDRLSGMHRREFDKALEWAAMGSGTTLVSDQGATRGLLEPVSE